MSQVSTISWGTLGIAYASLFVLGLSDNSRGPLFPDVLADLELSDTAGSLMFAATSGGVILGSLAYRKPMQRWPALRGNQVALLLSALGLVLIGVSPGLATLIAASALFGAALGGLAISQNLMVEEACPPELRRRGFAGLHAMYGAASLLAPLVVIGLSDLELDWRGCFLALAAVPLLPALAGFGVRTLPARGVGKPRAGGSRRFDQVLIASLVGLCVVAELLLSTRLPLLLRREGYSAERASLWLSLLFACLLAGRLFFTVVAVPISNRKLLAASAASSLAIFLVGLLVEPLLLPLVALAVAPFFPAATDLLAEEFPDELEGALSTLFVCVSLLVMIAHGLVGLLSDVWTLRAALGMGPAALAGTLVLLWISGRRAR